MKLKSVFKVLSLLLIMATVSFSTVELSKTHGQIASSKDATYDRVVNTGVIRAAYVVYAPGSIKDPNTGKLSGIFVETLNEAAKNMGMKVQWTEEVGWASMIEGLQAGRYDIVGTAIWPTSSRGKLVDFTVPLNYSVLDAFVRTDDNRFNADITKINDKSIKIATVDGEISQIVAQNQFPNATNLSLPQMSDLGASLLNVADNKADVAFVEPYVASNFLKNNPGKVKDITLGKPLLTYGNSMMIRKGDSEFKSMLDTSLTELINSGFVNTEMTKYEKDYAGAYYRVAAPFVVPQTK